MEKEKIKKFLMDLFFPSFCLGCKKEGFLLCQDCKSTLEILEYNYCLCSQNPTRIIAKLNKNQKCNRCRQKNLSGLYFALSYKDNPLVRKLIHFFKYEPYYLKSLAKVFAEILIEYFVISGNNKDKIWESSILIPVPLETTKLKKRGYNQSEELAKELLPVLGVDLAENNLVKIKKTLPQMKLLAKERQENLKNAFLVKDPGQIKGKKVFLVDDVYTTGSTMEECARVLRNAGAKSVWGITIAREG